MVTNINNQFAPLIVPKRTEGESLDWFYRGSQENIELCSIDIEMIKMSRSMIEKEHEALLATFE